MHLVAIGGSDAGISAALRAREVEPGAEVISSSVRIRSNATLTLPARPSSMYRDIYR